ncbi:tetrahydromethanopterin S-methyltransferase subunit B [Methanotorris formicicus]|uniref:Tetrahydromethanopterin S-methyltransferase subunit B n=1 Tax=Methanotorris formicicus Mc-S-70 TaxID=647171 RepID=H1KXL1_9EURY|nr:tetrahydromethanopterin S-methyltransferase subunit B [Methanotorris formicicus]EHP88084.1 Tetrahydromethanopterin S-methyltransferase [Methanotorris formicicus Mc-S-70]
MEIVRICPEINVVMEVDSGLVAEMRKDILVVDLTHVEEEVKKLERLATALKNSLDPRNPPLRTFDGRDGVYKIAGLFKGMFFGFWITLAILMLVVILVIKMNLSLIGL